MYGSEARRWLATRLAGVAVERAAPVPFPELVRQVGDAVRGAR